MKDRITESRPYIFVYKCEKTDIYYEIEIVLLPRLELVTNFIKANHEIEDFICQELIENLPEPALGYSSIVGIEQILTNELSCINLYPYEVNIRLMPYPEDSEVMVYNEVEIMDFRLFLDYLERN